MASDKGLLSSCLLLSDLIEPEVSESCRPIWQVPVRFRHFQYDEALPAELLIFDNATEADVEPVFNQMCLNQSYHVYSTEVPGLFLTVPMTWDSHDRQHYVYCPHLDTGFLDVVCHSAHQHVTEHDHMKFLYDLGLNRAVVLRATSKRPGLSFVQFHNNVPSLDGDKPMLKETSPSPGQQPFRAKDCLLDVSKFSQNRPTHRLRLGLGTMQLEDFLTSGLKRYLHGILILVYHLLSWPVYKSWVIQKGRLSIFRRLIV